MTNKEIVYIEYQNGKPFSVYVAEKGKWGFDIYDFEVDCYDENSFMYYKSGSGGFTSEIQAPHYIEGCEDTCCFWIHPMFKLRGKPKNIKQINEPLVINGSKDPFANSSEVNNIFYCKYCDKHLDEDLCEHLETDDDGCMIYMNGEPYE